MNFWDTLQSTLAIKKSSKPRAVHPNTPTTPGGKSKRFHEHRELNSRERGELDFWIDYVNGGCERVTGRNFIDDCAFHTKERLDYFLTKLQLDFRKDVWLDVGCGPHSILFGTDLPRTRIMTDPLMRSYFSYRLVPQELRQSNDLFIESPGELLPFPDNLADVVFTTNALDHVYEPLAVVRECARVTTPGGLVFLEVDIEGITDELHPHYLTDTQIDDLFIQFGFEVKAKEIFSQQRRPKSRMYRAAYQAKPNKDEFFPLPIVDLKSFTPTLVEESVNHFNIVSIGPTEDPTYYAIRQADGAFSYERVQNGGYRSLYFGPNLDEVRHQALRHRH